jgi:hypothetical protein
VRRIGTLGEKSLHAALKAWYAHPDDRLETPVDGYIADIVRCDAAAGELLIEIQTGRFGSIKQKLTSLLDNHRLRLVYPIAQDKWIVTLAADGETRLRRRKSPRRGITEHLFLELVSIPKLVCHPNFAVEVLLVQEEEIRRDDGRGSWKRGGISIHDHRLLAVVDQIPLDSPSDYRIFLPPELAQPFTSADLATALKQPRDLAQKMIYCLREIGVIEISGKKGRALVYKKTEDHL